ncbi:protein BUNDLE SHEATH DEFECTIVE 2, chloroplastic isoform X2 [Telopea speciosissima]|uniref:protein BUNDLE SHEATH DEFECTIVE 2, chloroplastic isoform X2 n=1 Tax=Telopea speciosissima TaxID=54955 RepID=UPI001CC4F87D|nr:protein BUNDLE SHEATH DEFECTIVE 2, chloroplastic isoform X2 [Telopea speciosissima]
MANALCFTPVTSFNSNSKPGILIGGSNVRKVLRIEDQFRKSRTAEFLSVEAKAADSNKSSTKSKTIVCVDCDGNGAVLCSQCKGSGVNSVDHFNGQFKAGGLCWLCRGKKDILCGSCNGAGFLGGFMSTFDE